MGNTPFFIALVAGFLSFLSPCVLPLLPSYLSFITGISLEELIQKGKDSRMRKITIIHSLIFIFGFSLVFVLLGTSASLVGKIFTSYQIWITRVGGIFIIIFGLHLMGVVNLGPLQREKLIRAMSMPALRRPIITSCELEVGPMVQIILALRIPSPLKRQPPIEPLRQKSKMVGS